MKRSEIFFSAVQVPVDFLMIVLAAISAYFLRGLPIFEGYVSRVFNLSFNNYLDFALIVAPFFLLVFAIEGLYTMRATRSSGQEIYRVTRAITLGLVFLIIAVFLKREWFSSRFVILVGWALTVVYVILARYIIQRIQNWLLVNKGIGIHRALLIGYNAKMKTLRSQLMKNKMLENVGFKWVSLYHKKRACFKNKPFVIPLGFEPKTL